MRASSRLLSAALNMPIPGSRVAVAMSGGVDSSACAYVLAKQGWDVQGFHMSNWDPKDEDPNDTGCTAQDDAIDARRVCEHLQMPFHQVSFEKAYWLRVFEPMLEQYQMGKVPNPDVWCNREIKFAALLDHVHQAGFTHLATGHYARTRKQGQQVQLLQGVDSTKDQSYFLATVPGHRLASVLLPLGELTKVETRRIASEAGLHTANKKESMGICFVGKKRRFGDFLLDYLGEDPGEFVDLESGDVLGSHKGAAQFTIGQKANIGGLAQKRYVVSKDMKSGRVIVAGSSSAALFSSALQTAELQWVAGQPPEQLARLTCRYRHGMQPVSVNVTPIKGQQLHIEFDSPQRGVQAGQVAVLYDGDVCLGGGMIAGRNVCDANTILPT